jgi:hypothetical protein
VDRKLNTDHCSLNTVYGVLLESGFGRFPGRKNPKHPGEKAFFQFMRLSGVVQGGFYFHPSDKRPVAGSPGAKKPLGSGRFGPERLEKRVTAAESTRPAKEGHLVPFKPV